MLVRIAALAISAVRIITLPHLNSFGTARDPTAPLEVRSQVIIHVSLDRPSSERSNSSCESSVVFAILSVIFAYFSPDVTYPLASALAASVGFAIAGGRAPIRPAFNALRSHRRTVAGQVIRSGIRQIGIRHDE